jgi:predicted RNase H-like nuclease (RuvC/YqgF family)
MRAKCDAALGSAEESKRKASLLQEELRNQRSKFSKITQEKMKMERDYAASQRATMALAKSVGNGSASDSDYYKRKVSDLNSRVQSMHATISEQNRQIQDLRNQLTRNMSQNHLAKLGRSGANKST